MDNHCIKLADTAEKYSYLWSESCPVEPTEGSHFNSLQQVIPEKIIRGNIGLDLGCGYGWDTLVMAKNNPSVRIMGIDISDGVYTARRLSQGLKNANIIKGSISEMPLKDRVCDFIYSFGVLHHLPDYKKGFLEVARVLKKDSPCFLYLYEDHADNIIKYMGIKIIALIRKVTVKVPPRFLYFLCSLVSPLIVLIFSSPARFFKKFKVTRKLYEKMPFNFGNGLFSLRGDLYDRFATPIEHRFSRKEIFDLFSEYKFYNINIIKLKDFSGWVAWGYKND